MEKKASYLYVFTGPDVTSVIMALTKDQKLAKKTEFREMVRLIKHFSKGTVEDLYVIDKEDIFEAGDALGMLSGKLTRAAHTRGKQGHGKKRS